MMYMMCNDASVGISQHQAGDQLALCELVWKLGLFP